MARRHGIVWQRGFFDHRLRDSSAWQAKTMYVRLNPVRAGLCKEPDQWPYQWDPTVGADG